MATATPRYYLLYLPLALAWFWAADPVVSFVLAWLGSFLVFYVSMAGKVKPVSPNLSLPQKLLQPIFLMQFIFAGYMSCSSIFYFLDLMGYEYLTPVAGKRVDLYEVELASVCQRYYLLGHAALAHALLFFYPAAPTAPRYRVQLTNWPLFFLKVALVCFPLAWAFSKIGALAVLAHSVEGLALVAATLAFALALPMRQPLLLLAAGGIFGFSLVQALTSGFKEPVIVSVLMLGIFLFPFYKKTITIVFVPLLLFLLTVLPTYVNTFRSQNWSGDADAESAKQEALKKVQEEMEGDGLAETNWAFLTGRISEIGMFTRYVHNTRQGRPYYGLAILGQSAEALVPRVLWSEKPITEYVAMIRVWENGIVSEESIVSAKPQYIVDGYLSGGAVGVWLALFVYGALAQLAANKAEHYFGGYFFGTAFVYTGMFRILWRGNCFEFLFNNIFYTGLAVMVLWHLFRRLGVLVPLRQEAAGTLSPQLQPG